MRVAQRLPGRRVQLNTRLTPTEESPREALTVERFLPTRDRRMVGAWCFLDRYGPADVADGAGMQVPPHPHTGLQTVSWLLAGEVLHRDSLGFHQPVRPGQLNLMTAGRGISHSERSPADRPDVLHGVQLWVALPAESAGVAPEFEHHAELPVLRLPGVAATVLLGTLGDVTSPARTFTPIVGADLALEPAASARVPLRGDFEYAVLPLAGDVAVDGLPSLDAGDLVYLGNGRDGLDVESATGGRLLLLGGEPFEEQIVMWWNFVGRSHEDVAAARAEWEAASARFGDVSGDPGGRLPAPPLPDTTLRARGRER